MRVLVVEDEATLRETLRTQLINAGFTVDVAQDGEEGLFAGLEYPLDVAIIDLGLPKLPGLDLIRKLRAEKRSFPILVLTARDRWQDKVEGLQAGADDYVVKPFHFEEVLARLQAFFNGKNHQRQKAYQWPGNSSVPLMPSAHHHTQEPPLAPPTPDTPHAPVGQPAGAPAAAPQGPINKVSHQPAPRLQIPVRPAYRERIGHDEKYAWVTGQLVRLQGERDMVWVLVYATPEEQDPHGGALLLTTAADMRNYRDGDLVSVQGRLLNGGRPSEQLGLPMYSASDINLVERGD